MENNLKINLGKNINSNSNEYAPVISPDGKTLYFCRQGYSGNLGYSSFKDDQDIWVSYKNKENAWEQAINIGTPLNNKYPNAVCSVSPDGKYLLVLGNYNKEGSINSGLSYSFKNNNYWSYPQKINIDSFYNHSIYAHFNLANNGKILLMSLEREDSFGNLDLYVSFLKNDSSWTIPKNLGNIINT